MKIMIYQQKNITIYLNKKISQVYFHSARLDTTRVLNSVFEEPLAVLSKSVDP
jgi:hypothetical protein